MNFLRNLHPLPFHKSFTVEGLTGQAERHSWNLYSAPNLCWAEYLISQRIYICFSRRIHCTASISWWNGPRRLWKWKAVRLESSITSVSQNVTAKTGQSDARRTCRRPGTRTHDEITDDSQHNRKDSFPFQRTKTGGVWCDAALRLYEENLGFVVKISRASLGLS